MSPQIDIYSYTFGYGKDEFTLWEAYDKNTNLNLRRSGILSNTCYDNPMERPFNGDNICGAPDSAWFKTREECQANVDKHFPPIKPKKVRTRKKRVYYKLVKIVSGDYYSAAKCHLDNFCATAKYEVGEVVKPPIPGSRLFVFGTLDAARNFQNGEMSYSKTKIFTCEVANPKRVKYLPSADAATSFWETVAVARAKKISLRKARNIVKKYFYPRGIPTHSYSVDSVKLLKEVV
jgi:hypothetical protein